MGDLLSGSWWCFDQYEIVEHCDEDPWRLGIRPAKGATATQYPVLERGRDLGLNRAPYVQLARVGAALREWYIACPALEPMTQERVQKYHDDPAAPQRDTDRYRTWVVLALVRALDKPVLKWCQDFGLFGPGDGAFQGTPRWDAKGEQFRSLGTTASESLSSESYWRTYEEDFASFAFDAVVMDHTLRGLKDSKPSRRAESLERFRLMLEPVYLTAVENAGSPAPALESTSLSGYLTAAACFDLAGGVRVDACQWCGKLFASRRQDRLTCSTRCQEARKKKIQRDDPAKRAKELARQKAARADQPKDGPSR